MGEILGARLRLIACAVGRRCPLIAGKDRATAMVSDGLFLSFSFLFLLIFLDPGSEGGECEHRRDRVQRV
jgi:hypothetical protein